MTGGRVYGLGMVGAGSFGKFCLDAYQKMPNINLVAVCDTDADRLHSIAGKYGMIPYIHFNELLANKAVEVVAINTPPSSHAELAIAAMRAGKHVFCEKPLATSLSDAEAMLRLAKDTGVMLTVNYVMRANPLYRLLKQLGELQVDGAPVFGSLRRCSLENIASDENLDRDHWFWNETLSGGIFVEHGVHFFDLFGWQLGSIPRKVVAMTEARDGGMIDTVQAIVSYEGGATSSSFHSFTHANAGEYQAIIFSWDWADAELHGWIALDLHLEALLDDESLELLADKLAQGEKLLAIPGENLLPDARIRWSITDRFPKHQIMKGHGEERPITGRVVVEASLGGPAAKLLVYEQCVRAGLAALLSSIEIRQPWVIPPANLWSSTSVAIAANEAAATGQVATILPAPFLDV